MGQDIPSHTRRYVHLHRNEKLWIEDIYIHINCTLDNIWFLHNLRGITLYIYSLLYCWMGNFLSSGFSKNSTFLTANRLQKFNNSSNRLLSRVKQTLTFLKSPFFTMNTHFSAETCIWTRHINNVADFYESCEHTKADDSTI